MYICRATTLFGQAQDTAKLTIQGWSTSHLVLWTLDHTLNLSEHHMPVNTGTSGYKLWAFVFFVLWSCTYPVESFFTLYLDSHTWLNWCVCALQRCLRWWSTCARRCRRSRWAPPWSLSAMPRATQFLPCTGVKWELHCLITCRWKGPCWGSSVWLRLTPASTAALQPTTLAPFSLKWFLTSSVCDLIFSIILLYSRTVFK